MHVMWDMFCQQNFNPQKFGKSRNDCPENCSLLVTGKTDNQTQRTAHTGDPP